MDLTEYMSSAAERLVKNVLHSSVADPRETVFLMRFARSVKNANAKREKFEQTGMHVPIFLISSVTTSCNLFCKGCYARANGICGRPMKAEMGPDDWTSVFYQAEELGIPFNILAGGEPLMRKDVILAASEMKNTVFPIFTNGTMIDKEYLDLFKKCRHLIPVLSLEGGKEKTDIRRGNGTYDKVLDKMRELKREGLFYGLSVTVTKENQDEILSDTFLNTVRNLGCRIMFLIEFVPADKDLNYLAPDRESRIRFDKRLDTIRHDKSMQIMSFPGDEKYMGGCIGAGRGFFHINPYGDAEACPASPHSDVNLMNSTLKDVISSPLFAEIRKRGMMDRDHAGGCALSEIEDDILSILASRS